MPAEKKVNNAYATLRIVGSISKYSPTPPHMPNIFLSERERYNDFERAFCSVVVEESGI